MDQPTSSPLIVPLLFMLRCLIPLLILVGISYLLRRLGLVTENPPEPEEERPDDSDSEKGDLVHGSV
jgi:hypothetical protein